MNRHSVVQVKKDLDRLIKDSEKLAFLLDGLENKEFELITTVWGGGYRTIRFEEIESMLEDLQWTSMKG